MLSTILWGLLILAGICILFALVVFGIVIKELERSDYYLQDYYGD